MKRWSHIQQYVERQFSFYWLFLSQLEHMMIDFDRNDDTCVVLVILLYYVYKIRNFLPEPLPFSDREWIERTSDAYSIYYLREKHLHINNMFYLLLFNLYCFPPSLSKLYSHMNILEIHTRHDGWMIKRVKN